MQAEKVNRHRWDMMSRKLDYNILLKCIQNTVSYKTLTSNNVSGGEFSDFDRVPQSGPKFSRQGLIKDNAIESTIKGMESTPTMELGTGFIIARNTQLSTIEKMRET